MSTVLAEPELSSRYGEEWLRWLPVVFGLLALYGPTFYGLANSVWTEDDQMHGPIVLAVVAWIVWTQRADLVRYQDNRGLAVGVSTLLFGLALYILGRSQQILVFEVGSIVPVLMGTLLAMSGWRTLWRFKFALLFLLFMVPLPGMIVDALTGPLKQYVSGIAEIILYAAGYPIGRTGVVLTVGPYQLLVADACSGLHSLISMSAMGLLYIFLMRHSSIVRNAVLVACLLPIAFTANVIRVMVLVLVTYHFGDEVGQGFIHDFSGIFLFLVGLLLLFAIDGALGRIKRLEDRYTKEAYA